MKRSSLLQGTNLGIDIKVKLSLLLKLCMASSLAGLPGGHILLKYFMIWGISQVLQILTCRN